MNVMQVVGRAWNLDLVGTYAQTELGHGTFIRGLELKVELQNILYVHISTGHHTCTGKDTYTDTEHVYMTGHFYMINQFCMTVHFYRT
jgi:hypothetical protein